jgi:hypothetical protein
MYALLRAYSDRFMGMKLSVEMVPEPIWGMNLRSDDGLGRYRWGKLRKAIIAERGMSCTICGSEDQPHGHEIWKYEEKRKTGVATLIGVEIIRRACHQIHHWGVTTRLAVQGAIPLDEVRRLIRHFCKVNGCKPLDFKRHADEAMVVFQRRSELRWSIDWGEYTDAVRNGGAARPPQSGHSPNPGSRWPCE